MKAVLFIFTDEDKLLLISQRFSTIKTELQNSLITARRVFGFFPDGIA